MVLRRMGRCCAQLLLCFEYPHSPRLLRWLLLLLILDGGIARCACALRANKQAKNSGITGAPWSR